MNWIRFVLLLALWGQAWGQVATASTDPVARVIVKFKDDGNVLRRASSVERTQSLSKRLGHDMQHVHDIAAGHQVMTAKGLTSTQLVQQLSSLSEVEFAEPDHRRKINALPNDPLFSSQWYLQNTEASASNFTNAWNLGTGSHGTVVAVLDTGMTDHPDLQNKLVPGYNFISDPVLAMNTVGRTSNPADPGDYIDASVRNDPAFVKLCGAADLATDTSSSWHGTKVASLIAAQTQNAIGMAGAGWGLRILPIRVLGKCGGYDSDIQAAMLWAAGIAVPGVPLNPYPASVINLSLGSTGTCSQSYASVLSQLSSKVVVVAAAGNESGPVDTPANCTGILGVAGLRQQGDKVGYSSYGKEVGLSAPAGNCVNTGANQACLFPMNAATNAGAKGPTSPTYTDGFNYSVGTSFSSPLVAAAAGLMMDLNPALSPSETVARLKVSVKPFVQVTGRDVCSASNSNNPCNCNSSICGSGMLDAAAAMRLAAPGGLAVPESGWWWNANESGRGYSLEVQGNRLFMAAYMYGADGRAVWYVSAGTIQPDGTYTGDVTEYAGGQTLSGAYKAAHVKATVAQMRLQCTSSSACNLVWAGRTVPITRFRFDDTATSSRAPESGWWWNADESGRGFFVEVQGNTLFLAGYMYDAMGNAVWYIASGAVPNQRLNANWMEYANGQTLTGSYQAAQLKNSAVGSVRLVFINTTTAVLTLPDGRPVALSRFEF